MSDLEGLKICLAGSAGGHLSQLLKLADSWRRYDTFCVTTTDVVTKKLEEFGNVYIVGECNWQHPLRVIRVFWRCLQVVFKERPDVVISTGAAPGCITCFLAKVMGAKVLWIDSITNIERLSLSGRMIRYIADLFIVQWPEFARRYKNVEYYGPVI
jgi:UDP-N-acetylglucosamine:LPS N-acetylglucosamine transferase